MAVGEEEKNKGESKGFAGLSSLVSDVDASLPPPVKQELAGSGASSSAERPTASENAHPDPLPTQQQPYQAPSQPPSGSSTGKWVLGVVAVIGVFWLIGQGNKQPSSPASAYSPPAQTTAPSYSTAPAQPQAPSRPDETRPPVGQDLVFSTAQIRYCLAEDIRMEGAKAAVNNYIDSDVDRFNAMVADYNSRCGSFRYRSGALESARRDIEQYRSQLQAEGRSRFARSPSTGSLSTPAPARPASDATVRAIQRKLNELGYNAGTPDGLMGSGTRAAIIAFQQDRGVTATGVADQALLLQLQQAPPHSSRSGPPANSWVLSPAVPSERGSNRDNANKTIAIPANSFQYSGNAKGWACNSGYRDVGNDCVYINKPQNAFHYSGNAKGWACNSGYRDVGNDCVYINKPQNAFHYSGNAKGWACNSGYKEVGDECWKVETSR